MIVQSICSVASLLNLSVQVRNGEATWRDTRKQLRKDHRWELASLLEREEKEQLFEEHIKALAKKSREMFHKLLDEKQDVSDFL